MQKLQLAKWLIYDCLGSTYFVAVKSNENKIAEQL